jgi:hypothetical protein
MWHYVTKWLCIIYVGTIFSYITVRWMQWLVHVGSVSVYHVFPAWKIQIVLRHSLVMKSSVCWGLQDCSGLGVIHQPGIPMDYTHWCIVLVRVVGKHPKISNVWRYRFLTKWTFFQLQKQVPRPGFLRFRVLFFDGASVRTPSASAVDPSWSLWHRKKLGPVGLPEKDPAAPWAFTGWMWWAKSSHAPFRAFTKNGASYFNMVLHHPEFGIHRQYSINVYSISPMSEPLCLVWDVFDIWRGLDFSEEVRLLLGPHWPYQQLIHSF